MDQGTADDKNGKKENLHHVGLQEGNSSATEPVHSIEQIGSSGLHDLVASIPADLQNSFETVCNHFLMALKQQFRLHDNVAVHLDAKLLSYVLQNKISTWSNADKASFLTALLPRKRMNDVLKPAARKLVESALDDEDSYVKLLASMMLPFIVSGFLSTNPITNHPSFKRFVDDINSNFSGPIFTNLIPNQALFLSAKSLKDFIPSGIESKSSVTFKDDFKLPTEEERYASYGVTKGDSPITTPRSGTPPLTSSSHRNRQPSSLFIPSGLASIQSQAQKSATLRGPASSRGGFKKEGKIKMMEFDEAEAAADQRKKAEISLRAEKEAAREAKIKEAEEKRLKKLAAEEEKRVKAAERESKKRKSSIDHETSQSLKSVRVEAEDLAQNSNQQSSVTTAEPLSVVQSPVSHLNPTPLQSSSASSQVNFQLSQVLDGATELSEHDVEIISLFLKGQYEIQENKKLEFKLTERIFMDGDVKKRESFYIVLDYHSCKWRKIKRTKKL